MENISTVAELRNAIQILEAEQYVKGQVLKEQLFITYEGMKPANLIRSTLNDLTASPFLLENIIGTTVGLATGFLSKKIVIGVSGNLIKKLIGSFLQLGVTNLVAHHPDTIKSFGNFIIHQIFSRKINRSEDRRDR